MSQDEYKQWEEVLAQDEAVITNVSLWVYYKNTILLMLTQKVTFEDKMKPEQTLLYRKGKTSPPIPLSTISASTFNICTAQ